MANAPSLRWLPPSPTFRAQLKAIPGLPMETAWESLVALANTRLDFIATNALDQVTRRVFAESAPPGLSTKPVRLALLGSSTLAHLHAAIRVAGVRRGIWITTYENDYGQYLQELMDSGSALHAFAPTEILLAFDAHHLVQGLHVGMDGEAAEATLQEVLGRITQCWQLARGTLGCAVQQQTALNVMPALMGNNEQRLPGGPRALLARLNEAMRPAADAHGVDLLAIDDRVAIDGLDAWHDPALWHRSKQEVALPAAPFYGDLVGRLVAARQGRSAKCLVLDLDNTLWGGVIGDDGLDGIVIGQGSPLGEGFSAVQDYARDLSRRGVILAVCSKNDEANALEPFESHPDMVLKRADIASFQANWSDKATNIRAIAQDLNIGLDSLVFLDDNPFERSLVRQELPMVAVPEVEDDPALVPRLLADAGYFEGLAITAEDRERTGQYQSNRARASLMASATDLDGYLAGLEMQLTWRRFDSVGLQRIVQLINKTNQFNLTTKRHTEASILEVMNDPNSFGLQLRLLDRFGDNGIIAIVIGRKNADGPGGDVLVDTWLMSCRVLGRQVEPATLNLLAKEALRVGGTRLVGQYLPTKKNGMVRDHYAKLGFTVTEEAADGTSLSILDLDRFVPTETFITVTQA